jgi:type VI secretion system secreted protein VgrG
VAQREARIKTEAKGVAFRLRSLHGKEELSRVFFYDLVVSSDDNDLKLETLLGTGLTVTIDAHDATVRHFHGLVANASYLGTEGPRSRYAIRLAPWLWFLDTHRDSRIFQNRSVPDIVGSIFEDHGSIADFDPRLTESYDPRDYCVQYRESDLNFVCRLLEEEGIYFFFEHREDAHKLVLVDHPSKHNPAPGYATVPYYPPDMQRHRERDHLDGWQSLARVRPGKATLKDFDFENPRQDLTSLEDAPKKHALADAEVFDYPGDYLKLDQGDVRARVRLEELQANHKRSQGAGNAAGLCCGNKFKLSGFPRDDQNIEYLLVAVESRTSVEAERSGADGADEAPFRCTIEAHDIKIPYRPERRTRKPFVHGPQTAMVTGPAGDEIYTDKYGRVKLQFHWDREGKKDENSSCWVRVSQSWAGPGFGAMHIPRVGQECVVDFLEGDPDRPIITGRVYNGLAMPPYGLPGSATQSGLKSNSSKGGGGSNELRFEDKKGAEEVYFHAQKDFKAVVEHDGSWHIKNNQTVTIDVNEQQTVHGARTRKVVKAEKVDIEGGLTETIKGGAKLDVTGDRTVTSTTAYKMEAPALTLNGKTTVDIGTKAIKVDGLTIDLKGTATITLSVGGSSIKLDPSGVTILGPLVKIN